MLFPLMQCRLAQSLVMGAESAQKVLLHLNTLASKCTARTTREVDGHVQPLAKGSAERFGLRLQDPANADYLLSTQKPGWYVPQQLT